MGLSSKSKVLTTFRGGLGAWQGAPLHPFSSTVARFTPRFQAAARTGLRTAALGGQGQKQAVLGGMAAQRHIGGPLIASVFRQGAPAARSELSRLLCEAGCNPDDWSSPHGLLPQPTGGNRWHVASLSQLLTWRTWLKPAARDRPAGPPPPPPWPQWEPTCGQDGVWGADSSPARDSESSLLHTPTQQRIL